jgi:hypothetical protein
MKVFLAVTKKQALEAAKKLQQAAEQMVDSEDETQVHILGIEVQETVPEGRLTPREYPYRSDQRLPPGWRGRVKRPG